MQLRPSTGIADNKESDQITLPRMEGLWPSGEELSGFKAVMFAFERANSALGMKALSCFAMKLGFAPDFFTDAHDPLQPDDQSTLHRVRRPRPDECLGPRYSLSFFCQANKGALIQGPEGKYDPITAHDYMQQRIAANFTK